MQAVIGTISKRINSTKNTFSGTTHQVVLKDPVSRENPVLLVTGAPSTKSNYMSWNGWYYWVDDITSETNNMYKVYAHVDPLGTWKSAIKATTGMINFGPASKMSGFKIRDPRLTPDVLYSKDIKTKNFNMIDYTNGSVVLQVLDMHVDSSDPSGGISTICCSLNDFKLILKQYAHDLDTDLSNLQTDFEKLIGKMAGLGNAVDAIKSAVWVPLKLSQISGGGYNGNIGGYNMPSSGTYYWCNYWASPVYDTTTLSFAVPAFVGLIAEWLKGEDFLNFQLTSPGGVLNIASDTLINDAGNVTFKFKLVVTTHGEATLYVWNDSTGENLGIQQWNCGVDLMQYTYKEVSAFEAGLKLGTKVGFTAVAGIAAAGGAVAAAGSAIGVAGAGAGSEAAFNAGMRLNHYGNTLQSMSAGVQQVSNGIQGVVSSIGQNAGIREFGGPSNITALWANDNMDILRVCMWQYVPAIMKSGGAAYATWTSEYGNPVFNYGDMSDDGPYQMAGATCVADAPPRELSIINSTINSLIYIE